MRPDRIIVGEVRSEEALDMLQAMNTGHDGSISTGHANSSKDMLTRLEMMVLMGAELPLEAIKSQIASAIDILIHLERMRDGSRKVVSVEEVIGYQEGEIILSKLYEYNKKTETLQKTKNRLQNQKKLTRTD
jgi:pilus assembly protein CpaF